ncbi:glyoxylase-like metal-dependent hydrolase (beta-lactamase superfamily II) [Agromyces hippuratus]|uniref:Glyoxylase-like metal-dependent hydrolase (Beta-lactamase superfamily II) n=1 Tax=Agromyces hippuratus TaxID=286438 RepID=A0A852X379_9MICO|nr:MBL fold metallo-hydrolase [Agromyces hippuratus]NYG22593.1 glyoxylase-like metal-dependent hydrolase (beta-lactamase superfamily II) [Agromyces hippuratus]
MDQAPPVGDRVSAFARLVLAPNAGPMTLDGTNSYVLRAPDSESIVVVDPGPSDATHLAALAGAGRVELVLITHHHPDHTESLDAFHAMTDAPVRAIDPAFCLAGAPLVDGERIRAAGLEIDVVATPGHTADSVCLSLPGDRLVGADIGDGALGTVLTGDTILGRGTTIIADPDGALGPYLDSLEALRALGTPGPVGVLPGHGPVLPDLAAICRAYLAHRAERLDQVRAALRELGADASTAAVTDLVYADTDASVRSAAEASVRAQLAYLRSEG